MKENASFNHLSSLFNVCHVYVAYKYEKTVVQDNEIVDFYFHEVIVMTLYRSTDKLKFNCLQ